MPDRRHAGKDGGYRRANGRVDGLRSNGAGDAGARHVGIIMDGNGRWAQARSLSRYDGYRAGTDAVRQTVESAADLGIDVLTLYAFSSDNWRRPSGEVQLLLSLFQWYLQRETSNCVRQGVRVAFIGRRDRFSKALQREIERSESATSDCGRLLLRIAADYSARDAILSAAASLAAGDTPTRPDFARMLTGGDGVLGDVDLIVRTGGEQRLSDFLLWEAAYAELVFTPTLWPDFTRDDLAAALDEFRTRERRFGGIVPSGDGSSGRRNPDHAVGWQPTEHPGNELVADANQPSQE